MPLDIAGIELKLDRAAQHLDALERSLDTFMGDDPNRRRGIAIEVDTERRQWRIVIHLPDNLPPEWGVLIGEVLYHLRSSLDHIVNGLVESPTRSNEFPIYARPSDYRSNEERLLAGVASEHRTTIYDLQPFRLNEDCPTETTIWSLHELARLDRHRFLHFAELYLLDLPIVFNPAGGAVIDWMVEMPCRIEHDAVVARGRYADASMYPDVEVNAFATADMVLSDLKALRIENPTEAGILAIDGLKFMLNHVRLDVLPRFS